MSNLTDFRLGHKHNAGDPEGRRVMTDKPEPVASEPRTELGRTLKELRGQAIADGMPLSSLEELRGESVASKLQTCPICETKFRECEPIAVRASVRAQAKVAPVASEPIRMFDELLPFPERLFGLLFQINVVEQVEAYARDNVRAALGKVAPVASKSVDVQASPFAQLAANPRVASKSVEDCMRLAKQCEAAYEDYTKYDGLSTAKGEAKWQSLKQARAALQTAIVAYGDAQYKAGRDAGVIAVWKT